MIAWERWCSALEPSLTSSVLESRTVVSRIGGLKEGSRCSLCAVNVHGGSAMDEVGWSIEVPDS